MSGTDLPTAPRNRDADHAVKLLDEPTGRGSRRRGVSRQTRAGARRGRPGVPRSGGMERRSRGATVAAVALGLGLVLLLHGGGTHRSFAEQRPAPRDYAAEMQMVSIDRVGTMFCAVVSQGFFLQTESARKRDLERLVRRIRTEGYSSLYVAEASGRTVASWGNGRVLELVAESDAGS